MKNLKELPEEIQRLIWYFVYQYCVINIKKIFENISELTFENNENVSYGKFVLFKLINLSKGNNKFKFSK